VTTASATSAADLIPPRRDTPLDRAITSALRVAARHSENLARIPGYPTGVQWLIRWEGVVTGLLEHERRLLSHAVGTATTAERRRRSELEARLERSNGRGWAAVAGRRLPVFWHEAGKGAPVLLLNGWTASGLLWPRGWLQRLEAGHRVVRIDNRGTGWSRTAAAPFTIGDMADDAAAVLRATGAGPATVLGLSMGGMIAQELAIRHPGLVRRLVLVGTRPPAPAHVPAAPQVLERELGQLLHTPRRGEPLAAYFRSVWEPQSAPGFAERHAPLFEELAEQIVERVTPRPAVINQLRAISAWSGPRRLRSITAETIVVHGLLDELAPVGNGMRLARLISGARYVELPGVGHLVPLEAPEALIAAIGAG
jgi:3-oxoadipate enol-lactonase